MANIGYIRVSSPTQSLERQRKALQELGCEKFFEDVQSGKDDKRQGLKNLLDWVREWDVVYVHSMDRLGRSLSDLLKITKTLTDRDVTVVFVHENITLKRGSTDPYQQMMFSMFGAFAEFERNLISIRRQEGLAAAASRGVKFGRKRVLTDDLIKEAHRKNLLGISLSRLAKDYEINPSTLSKNLKAYRATLELEKLKDKG